MTTLGGAMKELGHTKLDVLKFDIEGAEWYFLEEALADPETRKMLQSGRVRQIMLEAHFMPPRGGEYTQAPDHPSDTQVQNDKFERMLNDVESCGFKLFWLD